MHIIADTHVHLYSSYNIPKALRYLFRNLDNLDKEAVKIAFMAESYDCDFFNDIRDKKTDIPFDKIRIVPSEEKNVLVLTDKNKSKLHLFAGRQIVTSERIEILALTVNKRIANNMSAKDTINAILDMGGIPVISWAPGKWFFKRRKIVYMLIEKFEPGQLLLGDTIIRPVIWSEPLFNMAIRKGFSVIAGSDPLPFPEEEKLIGCYGTIMEDSFDTNKPISSIRRILKNPDLIIKRTGKRCGIFKSLIRMIKAVK